ncbi:NAD(P)H-dependent oxidoreductase [Phyllobacterium myrsinacearum]|uniref:NAD(P)H dehydrogenase (Quinone) n=1 Tax=Phyllobacterium myrsinacearum TaxID=28101 RepID=A0A839EHQ8_9HYPH|nr:NAD(P)H-dependent oxidoreductase [Phyllobacterium myrsinacearum]MBA8879521.1 NAD(P)H dehydrogenase (quinone) [Phyllobacterium myrsinacearum]
MSNILIVHAHPEPQSLTSALKNLAVDTLMAQGHEVQVSDLYASGWKAVADREDFMETALPDRFSYIAESRHAFASGTQSADVAAEQHKLLWADAVLFSFPMWWFGMPAILKGWVDRVFAYGFAYGVGAHGGERWGDRYGEGTLSGRRAMLAITIGGREPHYGERGVNGRLDDLLWPIQHGMLYYPGMEVLPPFVIYQSDRLSEIEWPSVAEAYKRRITGLFNDNPIAFRTQNGGHYDGQQVLKPGLGAGENGTHIHLVQPGEPEEVLDSRAIRARTAV